jgi:hypothetical protein
MNAERSEGGYHLPTGAREPVKNLLPPKEGLNPSPHCHQHPLWCSLCRAWRPISEEELGQIRAHRCEALVIRIQFLDQLVHVLQQFGLWHSVNQVVTSSQTDPTGKN